MSRDKQISEMTKDLCDIQCNGMRCNVCETGCEHRMLAEALYNAGYRKASDVAEDIIRMLRAAGINEFRYPIVADIKKKYESEDIK